MQDETTIPIIDSVKKLEKITDKNIREKNIENLLDIRKKIISSEQDLEKITQSITGAIKEDIDKQIEEINYMIKENYDINTVSIFISRLMQYDSKVIFNTRQTTNLCIFYDNLNKTSNMTGEKILDQEFWKNFRKFINQNISRKDEFQKRAIWLSRNIYPELETEISSFEKTMLKNYEMKKIVGNGTSIPLHDIFRGTHEFEELKESFKQFLLEGESDIFKEKLEDFGEMCFTNHEMGKFFEDYRRKNDLKKKILTVRLSKRSDLEDYELLQEMKNSYDKLNRHLKMPERSIYQNKLFLNLMLEYDNHIGQHEQEKKKVTIRGIDNLENSDLDEGIINIRKEGTLMKSLESCGKFQKKREEILSQKNKIQNINYNKTAFEKYTKPFLRTFRHYNPTTHYKQAA